MVSSLLLLFSVLSYLVVSKDYCDQYQTPLCPNNRPRDLLFLVDGSNSMDPAVFYSHMLDYTLALFCALHESEPNQAGMIVFNQEIQVYIPLGKYTRQQWKAQVETVRETQYSNFPACCSCVRR